ncbi:DUF397 domain-containing protein [Streptomyces sp. NPDC006711]|uniref:DUF397 domain-containing protein n=1 Tax=Streptomyces sp. NPDC006711 TaxID=3364762 RepID=UPI0036B1B12F
MTPHHTVPALTAYALAPEKAWTKSSYSNDGSGNCVEIAELTATIAVRDSKQPAGLAFQISPTAFSAFLAFAKNATV